MINLKRDALYHLDLILWVQQQPWDDRFIPVIEDARTFRDTLMMEIIHEPTEIPKVLRGPARYTTLGGIPQSTRSPAGAEEEVQHVTDHDQKRPADSEVEDDI